MIDNFSILLSHGLLALAFWFLLPHPELDTEAAPTPDLEPEGFGKKSIRLKHNNGATKRGDNPGA